MVVKSAVCGSRLLDSHLRATSLDASWVPVRAIFVRLWMGSGEVMSHQRGSFDWRCRMSNSDPSGPPRHTPQPQLSPGHPDESVPEVPAAPADADTDAAATTAADAGNATDAADVVDAEVVDAEVADADAANAEDRI